MKSDGPIAVEQLPEKLDLRQSRVFLRAAGPSLKSDRPRVVLDFSQVRRIDSAGVEMLLHCLEQVVERDGEIKLAAVPRDVAMVLELTRVGRLFEAFDTTDAAVESFRSFPAYAVSEFPAHNSAGTSGGMDGVTSQRLPEAS